MGRKAIDITGNVYGELTVIKKATLSKERRRATGSKWHCICSCGNETITDSWHMRNGKTTSCGCLPEAKRLKSVTTHGKSKNKLFGVWSGMIDRCRNKNNKIAKYYVNKDITVCDEWKEDFLVFYEWANKNGYEEGLTIDRIDGNGNYEPSNCRWVDMFVQNSNKSNNVYLEINGVTKTVSQWSRFSGVNRSTINSRFLAGEEGEELIKKARFKSDVKKQIKEETRK